MVPDSAKVVLEVGANTGIRWTPGATSQQIQTAFSFRGAAPRQVCGPACTQLASRHLDAFGSSSSTRHSVAIRGGIGGKRAARTQTSGTTDGCASLLSPVSSYYSPLCTNLSGIRERRTVPTVSLHKVLSSWLKGHTVQLAKIDAQGLDVGVVRSAGDAVSRVKAIQMEVVRDRPRSSANLSTPLRKDGRPKPNAEFWSLRWPKWDSRHMGPIAPSINSRKRAAARQR